MIIVKDRVEHILCNRPETRDSDIKLFAKFMNYYFDVGITIEQVEKLKKTGISYASIIRERSRFQNKRKQYMPSEEVMKARGQTQSKYRDRYGKQGRDR